MLPDKCNDVILKDRPVDARQWVAKYADYLYAYAISRIDNQEQAKDLVQETFLAALEGLDRFECRSSEKTWLTSILKHKIIDVYRKKSSGPIVRDNVATAGFEPQDLFDPDDGHWNPDHRPVAFKLDQPDILEDQELQSILLKCMQKLPALWLSVFTMKHMEDQSTEIICSALKVTTSNYWVIIHRAKLNLRACLQKNWI